MTNSSRLERLSSVRRIFPYKKFPQPYKTCKEVCHFKGRYPNIKYLKTYTGWNFTKTCGRDHDCCKCRIRREAQWWAKNDPR